MDPVTSISLALAVIVFLAVGYKLLSGAIADRVALQKETLEINSKDPGHIIANVFSGIFGGLQ